MKRKDEYFEKQKQIKLLESKNKILNKNKFEDKAINAFIFALLPYVVTVMGVSRLATLGIIPNELVLLFSLGIPAFIGIASSGFLNKKIDLKEKTSEFSSAKKFEEVLEEEILNEIERQKLISEKRVLHDLDKNIYFYEQTKDRYEAGLDDPRTEEEIVDNVQNIENLLKENDKELRIVTTQNVLKNKFLTTRDKWQKFMRIAICAGAGALLASLLCAVPYLAVPNLSYGIPIFFTALSTGAITGASFAVKRELQYERIFNKINNSLGENAISKKSNVGEELALTKKLENIIRNKLMMSFKLEKEKIKLESKRNKTLNLSKKNKVNENSKLLDNNRKLEEQVVSDYQKVSSPKVRTRKMK